MITVIGLGPGAIEDLTLRAWDKLRQADTVFLRTQRHPCVADLPERLNLVSFDEIYQNVDSFDDVYDAICARLMQEADSGRDALYAVPGDPMVGESTVARLLRLTADNPTSIEIIHGLSFIEPCLSLIGEDALDGLQILDALEIASSYHPPINPAKPALLAQIYDSSSASNLKLTLMNQYPDDFAVKLVHRAGQKNALVEDLPLYKIDRSAQTGLMTCLYLPALGPHSSFEAFQNIIAHLRSPEGCPWDREQTHQSLRPFLIEECYEVLDALDAGDAKALHEELGDLLLQIVLHAQIAIDDGEFAMADILRRVNEKMIRRHPHVWGDVDVQNDPRQATRSWEAIKRAEQKRSGSERSCLLDGIPKGAPALLIAHRYSQRASRVGFDWDDISGVEAKAQEEFDEILNAQSASERAQEIGDMIFVLVNWLRWLGVDDPESLLRDINAKFHRRFCYVEGQTKQQGKSLTESSLDELDALWQAAKRAGL